MPRLSVRAMATALGVSKSQVDRDAADGMPMHDAGLAAAWRAVNRDIARVVGARLGRAGMSVDHRDVGRSKLDDLHQLARLADVDFEHHEPALRLAIRQLPHAQRDALELSPKLIARLIGTVAVAWLSHVFSGVADHDRLSLGTGGALHDLLFELAAGTAWVAVTIERDNDLAA